jgi:hypothetical protein
MARSQSAKQLVDLFFLGQYMLVSHLAPSIAAGAITGEKERQSYEMLLARSNCALQALIARRVHDAHAALAQFALDRVLPNSRG